MPLHPDRLVYRERLWASPWIFVSTALVIPASLLVFLPINPVVGIGTAIVLYAGCVTLLIIGSPLVAVSPAEFTAGRARLPLRLAGQPVAYTGDEASLQRGRLLDARAWLMIRGWVSPVVKVPVLDDADPAPYWLVSTRRPDELVRAISEARESAQ